MPATARVLPDNTQIQRFALVRSLGLTLDGPRRYYGDAPSASVHGVMDLEGSLNAHALNTPSCHNSREHIDDARTLPLKP
jgi:hypothetical protein